MIFPRSGLGWSFNCIGEKSIFLGAPTSSCLVYFQRHGQERSARNETTWFSPLLMSLVLWLAVLICLFSNWVTASWGCRLSFWLRDMNYWGHFHLRNVFSVVEFWWNIVNDFVNVEWSVFNLINDSIDFVWIFKGRCAPKLILWSWPSKSLRKCADSPFGFLWKSDDWSQYRAKFHYS